MFVFSFFCLHRVVHRTHILLYLQTPGKCFPINEYFDWLYSTSKDAQWKRICLQCRRCGFDQEDPLEDKMATHSDILAWKIPQPEEPGGLQSMWSQRAGHDGGTQHAHTVFLRSLSVIHANAYFFCLFSSLSPLHTHAHTHTHTHTHRLCSAKG